jgi:hypothetical protein
VPLPRRCCRGHCAPFRAPVLGEPRSSGWGGHAPLKPNYHEHDLAPLQRAHNTRITRLSGICLLAIAYLKNYQTPILDCGALQIADGLRPVRLGGAERCLPMARKIPVSIRSRRAPATMTSITMNVNKDNLLLILFPCSRLVFP